MLGEPIRHQKRPDRDESNDQDWEANCCDCLRDGNCVCDAEVLDADEEPYL